MDSSIYTPFSHNPFHVPAGFICAGASGSEKTAELQVLVLPVQPCGNDHSNVTNSVQLS